MTVAPEFQVYFDTEFSAIRCVEKILLASHWTIQTQLSMPAETSSADFEHIIKKISFWVNNCLHHSIIFDVENTWATECFFKAYDPEHQNNIVLTPLVPDDAHMGCLILSKFNALSGNFAEFESIKMSSNSENGISYVYYGNGNEVLPKRDEWFQGKFSNLKPWWERNDATSWDAPIGNTCSPQNHPLFEEFFKENRSSQPNNATIIKGDFRGKER